ncbi:hypothetical protein [Mesobacillus zeae]|uniref:Uncharacterized protein n=1 Tax=Mesobacillus zeae TaxID=1917180 RepID=A0A398B3A0_9BACI|nr:hypothetical protein [Mesobacillus zeae]RID82266.1 hypothetical protein D1970_19750 [Mesobacillus zeae]
MSYDHVEQNKKMFVRRFFGDLREKGIKQSLKYTLEQKVENFKVTKADYKELLAKKMYTYKTIDGLFLWEVDRKLNRIARKGFKQKDLDSGVITIVLSRKQTNELATEEEKARLESTIDDLDGYENLRLRQFYRYKTEYCEKKFYGKVTRWVELKITNL